MTDMTAHGGMSPRLIAVDYAASSGYRIVGMGIASSPNYKTQEETMRRQKADSIIAFANVTLGSMLVGAVGAVGGWVFEQPVLLGLGGLLFGISLVIIAHASVAYADATNLRDAKH